jgi:bifunctional non-homologous end joining protein LigD
MNAVTSERVTLYYRAGSSDKVYQTAIEPDGNLFAVTFAYGRRGATLTTGTKTSSPVDYATARKIHAKLVSEKKAKGYAEGANGTPYQHAEKRASGLVPQLLNPITEAEAKSLLDDNDYCAQEKFDGRHLLVRQQGEQLEGINKKGLVVGLSSAVADELRGWAGDFILDGEAVGDDYHVFDLLALNGESLLPWPYRERFARLADLVLLAGAGSRRVRLVATAFRAQQKAELWERLQRGNREGIVFKRLAAPYIPGRPNRGGPQLKFKFVATASAIVVKLNVQRSVELSLFNGRSLVSCGNVTIPPNHRVPALGAVVEVRYLYAFKESGVLYQPVYLGERDNADPGECTVQQLKFKAE